MHSNTFFLLPKYVFSGGLTDELPVLSFFIITRKTLIKTPPHAIRSTQLIFIQSIFISQTISLAPYLLGASDFVYMLQPIFYSSRYYNNRESIHITYLVLDFYPDKVTIFE